MNFGFSHHDFAFGGPVKEVKKFSPVIYRSGKWERSESERKSRHTRLSLNGASTNAETWVATNPEMIFLFSWHKFPFNLIFIQDIDSSLEIYFAQKGDHIWEGKSGL